MSSDAPETEPDYSWFTMPEDTDKLVIWSDGTEADTPRAVSLFREQYPDVEIDYQIFGQDEYNTTVRAEIE